MLELNAMPIFFAVVALAGVFAQQPAESPKPEIPVLKAGLGGECSADFTVKDADGKPVYGAAVSVRVRYGAMGIKRADLEVGTNPEGKARIEGLPAKARPIVYNIQKDDKKGVATQAAAGPCHARFEVSLK